jgi:hypothetical protein
VIAGEWGRGKYIPKFEVVYPYAFVKWIRRACIPHAKKIHAKVFHIPFLNSVSIPSIWGSLGGFFPILSEKEDINFITFLLPLLLPNNYFVR